MLQRVKRSTSLLADYLCKIRLNYPYHETFRSWRVVSLAGARLASQAAAIFSLQISDFAHRRSSERNQGLRDALTFRFRGLL
jgi:hypothetical protein